MNFALHARNRFSVVCVTIAALTAPTFTRAADPLTWHFKAGDVHRYRAAQEMNASLDLGPAGSEQRTVRHVADVSWRVDHVKDDGQAVLLQKIDRLQLKLTAPDEAPVVYDSADEKEPEGFAAMVSPLVKEIIKSEVKVTMTPQGEVVSVEAPETLLVALKNSAGADKLGELATGKGLEKMIQTMSFRLPKSFDKGVEWTTQLETNNDLLGKETCKTAYKHKETREVDGQQLEVFTPQVEIKFEGSPAKIDVSDEKSSGEIIFNRTAGRLESSKIDHSMKLTLAAEGQEVTQVLDQKTEMARIEKGDK